jgi:glucokinase
MKSKYCIGVDLGGTNIAVGIVDLEAKIITNKMSIKTNAPRPCEAITADIVSVCRKLCDEAGMKFSDLSWVGVASPGIAKNGVIISASNLGWTNAPFAKLLYDEFHIPVYIANDANAAAYAEALWGSGRGAESLVALTLGTGVGGGIVFHGKIWEGMNGFAAEMGHMIIEPNGRVCGCGKRGCIEAYCSATALIRETKRVMQLYPESLMWQDVNGDIERVNGKTAFKAKAAGDKAADRVVSDFIDHLAIGVSNVINVFQPDVLCIGGGISREGEALMDPLCERVSHLSFGTHGMKTKVVVADFRNDAGIIGAALLGLQNKE